MSDLEDEEEDFKGIFENGHWEWDDFMESLVFLSDLPQIAEDFSPPTPTLIGSIEFKEDLDLLEQQRFRKRFQRKTVENDVIHLQDIKDVVCFTAPKTLITPSVVNILHLPVTERFLRALLLYCQYYLQISDEMSKRILDLHEKVRTTRSDEIEFEFRDNLEDLRLLVAKEYSSIIMGGSGIAKYHHMGLTKKLRSLSKRDSILFESILRISVQIVWLALGRKSYNQIGGYHTQIKLVMIKKNGTEPKNYRALYKLVRDGKGELEIHRLFKSEMYNIIEHKINTKYETELSKRELFVLFGHCVHRNRMINTYSPLNNEMHCDRDIDYRLLGLGSVKYSKLSYRLRYLERALIAPEENFEKLKMSLGILGLARTRFDTMLKEIKMPASTASSSSSFRQSVGRFTSASRASRVSTTMRKSALQQKLYEDVFLPDKYQEEEYFPERFPTDMLPKKQCDEVQRKKWMSYASLIVSRRSKRSKNVF